jgi:hypothetical protein
MTQYEEHLRNLKAFNAVWHADASHWIEQQESAKAGPWREEKSGSAPHVESSN